MGNEDGLPGAASCGTTSSLRAVRFEPGVLVEREQEDARRE
ncbi:hypothetical protein [Streptomyces nitrosporeus]